MFLHLSKGKVTTAEGTAVVIDPREPARLGISFSHCERSSSSSSSLLWAFCFLHPLLVVLRQIGRLALFHVFYLWLLYCENRTVKHFFQPTTRLLRQRNVEVNLSESDLTTLICICSSSPRSRVVYLFETTRSFLEDVVQKEKLFLFMKCLNS